MTPACTGLFERRRSGLRLLKSTFNGKISYAGCLGPSPVISAQFTQAHSKSLMLTLLKSSSPVLIMISSMFVHICNYFYTRRVNSGKITSFKGRECPSLASLFVGTPFTQLYEILWRNTKDFRLSYGKSRNLCLTWFWIGTGTWQTDTKTDRITAANTRYHLIILIWNQTTRVH